MGACFLALSARAGSDLNSDQLTLLRDPGGWQYIEVGDPQKGVQTAHTCFDGQPHPEECSGTLTFSKHSTFMQSLTVQGEGYQRHGTYQLDGDQLTLFDELGTQDGPYTVSVNLQRKTMLMQMSPAGGGVRCRFLLNREYRKKMEAHKQKKQS